MYEMRLDALDMRKGNAPDFFCCYTSGQACCGKVRLVSVLMLAECKKNDLIPFHTPDLG